MFHIAEPAWLLLLLGHIAAYVAVTLVMSHSQRSGLDPLHVAVAMQTGVTIMAWVGAATIGNIYPKTQVHPATYASWRTDGIIVAASAFTAFLQVANVNAVKHLGVGLQTLFYNLRLPFTTVLGLAVLNERLSAVRLMGGACMVTAVALSIRRSGQTITASGRWWGLACGGAVSLTTFTEKFLLGPHGVSFFSYEVPGMTLACLYLWTWLAWRQGFMSLEWRAFLRWPMVTVAAGRSISTYSFTAALARGASLSTANYLSSANIVLVTGVAAVLYADERSHPRRRILAALVAVTGAILTIIGSS